MNNKTLQFLKLTNWQTNPKTKKNNLRKLKIRKFKLKLSHSITFDTRALKISFILFQGVSFHFPLSNQLDIHFFLSIYLFDRGRLFLFIFAPRVCFFCWVVIKFFTLQNPFLFECSQKRGMLERKKEKRKVMMTIKISKWEVKVLLGCSFTLKKCRGWWISKSFIILFSASFRTNQQHWCMLYRKNVERKIKFFSSADGGEKVFPLLRDSLCVPYCAMR